MHSLSYRFTHLSVTININFFLFPLFFGTSYQLIWSWFLILTPLKQESARSTIHTLKCILFLICFKQVKHFDKHDLLYDLQHGFREKRSCDTQLTMLFEDLTRNTSVGKQTDLILLDFSKAFDKVNHSKLIWKLHQYGIRGNALSWIQAFLGNRSQTVIIEGEELGSVPVSSGVRQGSV